MTDTTIPQVTVPETAVEAGMGTRQEAEAALLARWKRYCKAMQPGFVSTSRKDKDRRRAEQHEATNRLAQAGAHLAWHIENGAAQPSEAQQAPCDFDPVAWFDVFNACVYFDADEAAKAVAGGNKVFPVESIIGSPTEPKALPAIDRDEAIERDYIPLPGGWEIQTKGKGSSFRLCDTKSGDRWIVMDTYLQPELERMAREIRQALHEA